MFNYYTELRAPCNGNAFYKLFFLLGICLLHDIYDVYCLYYPG